MSPLNLVGLTWLLSPFQEPTEYRVWVCTGIWPRGFAEQWSILIGCNSQGNDINRDHQRIKKIGRVALEDLPWQKKDLLTFRFQ